MLKTKVMSNQWTFLAIGCQYDLPEVFYIPKNGDNTFSEMNKKFLEVFGLILRYYQAQNQRFVKKTDNSENWVIIWHPGSLIHPEKRGQYIPRNEQQIPRGIHSYPEILSCSKPRLCNKNRQFLKLSDNLISWRNYLPRKKSTIHSQEWPKNS